MVICVDEMKWTTLQQVKMITVELQIRKSISTHIFSVSIETNIIIYMYIIIINAENYNDWYNFNEAGSLSLTIWNT